MVKKKVSKNDRSQSFVSKGMRKHKRTIQIGEVEATSIKTYSKFKREFPDFKYDRKTQTYKLPKRIEKQIVAFDKLIKEERREIIKETEKVKVTPPKKLRDKRIQATLNFINSDALDTGLIYVSIRALTKNPEIEEAGLRIVLREIYEDVRTELRLEHYKSYPIKIYYGFEDTEVSKIEDYVLNDGNIWIEIFYDGKAQQVFRYGKRRVI